MKIAFLTTLAPEDANTWSGTSSHILQTLRKNHEVKVVGHNMLPQALCFAKNNIAPKRDMREYSPVFGRLCAEEVADCDLVFFGDLYLAPYLETNIPLVHLSDVTYHSITTTSLPSATKAESGGLWHRFVGQACWFSMPFALAGQCFWGI